MNGKMLIEMPRNVQMPRAIEVGTILVKEGTRTPETVRFESEPYASDWRLIKNSDVNEVGRRIQEAGWTFFCLAGEMNVTVFGLDPQRTVRRAVEQILKDSKQKEFNSLEILRVNPVSSKRFLGVCYVTVSACSRHIQESAVLLSDKAVQRKIYDGPSPVFPGKKSHPEEEVPPQLAVTTSLKP
jgi:hypothetical protein